ncbi:histidine kinase 5 [Selaginella moellendorffii]|uniref:histidine kinase 5 n=1 Tax=Selaginella moellendorffii TaxID=88036 RepID=UPI000D1C7A92|nr:histidine kinase 5 [Selaginella moellendorffii]|eukprot:XP_024515573.1 histidine kinase 5 [Selaginella moellendorffii]
MDSSAIDRSSTENCAAELENVRAENAKLRSQNEALIREVEQLKLTGSSRIASPEVESSVEIAGLLSALKDSCISISYCDSDLRYVWATHFLESFAGKIVHGKHDDEIFPVQTKGLEEVTFLRKQALESGSLQMDYVQVFIPDRGHMTWLVIANPSFGHEGGKQEVPVGVITTCLNIPLAGDSQALVRSRTTEYELREAVRLTEEAIRAKNMFLSIMSHEIRTPLNGLLGLAQALESSGLDRDQRELLQAIVSSGTIIADILGDILDLASMESGAMKLETQPFSPADIVHEIAKMAVAATHEKGLEVLSYVGKSVPEVVIGDGLRVRQVMKYLVLNAIKFTQEGSVQIRLDSIPMLGTPDDPRFPSEELVTGREKRQKDQPVKSGCREGDFVLYCQIADTGLGIPKEAFATLFDHFRGLKFSSTINHGGTGLGLALCKQLVELMGGRLTVHSEVGKGSVFTFSVLCKSHDRDCSPEPTAKPVDNRPPCNHRRKEPKILLAEDNKVNVMVAISMLKRLGFTAQVVANGVEALEAMRKDKYDLVLLDICMPLMDGLQVAYAIRKFEQTGSWPEGIWDGNDSKELSTALEGFRNGGREEDSTGTSPRIPIIAVTANALRSDIERCFAHGMDAFIPKPVMFQKLREILSKYLPLPLEQQ